MEVATTGQGGQHFTNKEKEKDVRSSNIIAAKAIADIVRTSLGPKGMDKMIEAGDGEVIITNDGATILEKMSVTHPAAKMLVELSKAQDIEAGDGTTSVVVIAGALLSAVSDLLGRGIHPTVISEAFQKAVVKAEEICTGIAKPVDLDDRESLIKLAVTSLSSKVVHQNSDLLAPMAVDAVLSIIDAKTATNCDLRDIKVVTKVGGTIDDSELVHGMVFTKGASHAAGGPVRVPNAKIGLIQFCISAPKTDIENNVVISEYSQMDRILKEERKHILKICKAIKKTGCNVLLVQKSILRDAVNDMSLHFLAKLGIMVVKDIEREDIEFICKTVGCLPAADLEGFTDDKLGFAGLVEEVSPATTGSEGGRFVRVTQVKNPGLTCCVLVRGSNHLVLAEAERSLHDALCVIRCLVKKRYLIAGGGSPEIEMSRQIEAYSKTITGKEAYCLRAYADALEVIPYTLAENAGLHPIAIVTELRNRHMKGETLAGINVRKGTITNILDENVVQPLLVSLSSLNLATECVCMILKIDDLVAVR